MQQPLIVDQKAMAEKAMADLVEAIAVLNSTVTAQEGKDLNRAQLRAFRARMRPIQAQLRTLQFKQRMIQQQMDDMRSNNVA